MSEQLPFDPEINEMCESAEPETDPEARVEYTANEDERLDASVSRNLEISRTAAARLIEEGAVTVNGKVARKKSVRTAQNDRLSVVLPPERECVALPQDIPLSIVYEDDDVAVVNKPQGMVVHPAPGNPDGTLVNALLYHMKGRLSTINGVIRPGIVHRIDKDTAGLLAVAKNDAAHASLAAQIKAHSFTRVYNAVVIGTFDPPEGCIDAPIGRHPTHRKKMAVTDKNSKPAVTHYRTLERFPGYSFCEFRLETGRTHQIRVHSLYRGHPLVGDPLYAPEAGKNRFGLVGQCLVARVLGFIHPVTGEYMEFSCDLPDYFKKTLTLLHGGDAPLQFSRL